MYLFDRLFIFLQDLTRSVLLTDLGIFEKSISIGFGNVTWFSFTILELLAVVTYFIFCYMVIIFLIRLIQIVTLWNWWGKKK